MGLFVGRLQSDGRKSKNHRCLAAFWHPFAAVGKRMSRRSAKYPRRKRGRETMRAVGDAGPYGCVHRGAKYPHRRHERKTMRAVGDAGPYGCVHRGAPENKDRKRKNNFLMWTEKGNRRGPRRGRGEGEV